MRSRLLLSFHQVVQTLTGGARSTSRRPYATGIEVWNGQHSTHLFLFGSDFRRYVDQPGAERLGANEDQRTKEGNTTVREKGNAHQHIWRLFGSRAGLVFCQVAS